MQELYNTFESQSDILQDHNTHRRATSKAFNNVLDWKKHIKDRPHDFPFMDKLHTKKTKVTIETWERICDVVESIIKGGQEACRRRWMDAKTLLSFLDFPSLYVIDRVVAPYLKL